MAAKALAHGLQFAEPAHVALAPCRHAIAQPVLLAHDLAAKLVLLTLFFFQHDVAPFLEMAKALVQPAGLAAIEPHGGTRHALEEAAVVRDDDQRRRGAGKLLLQPFDDRQVEMVGRLIEEEDVGLRRHDAGKGSTAGFAAGEIVRPLLAGQAEMLHQIGGAIGIVGGSEPRLDIGADAGKTIHVGHLRQVAHCCRRLAEHLAILRLDQSRSDLQQRRLARAVAADQSDLVAR